MKGRFSPQRLYNIRRLRKARRLWKALPMFAFQLMLESYPEYDHQTFIDDLRIRKKLKKKMKKTKMNRFGRYYRISQLISKYQQTGNLGFAIQAMSMQKRLTRPYRLMVQLNGQANEYYLSALIPIQRIEELSAAVNGCKTWAQAEALIGAVRNAIN